LGFDSEPVNWVFIRAVLALVAEFATFPCKMYRDWGAKRG